jgi:hypothetical protein
MSKRVGSLFWLCWATTRYFGISILFDSLGISSLFRLPHFLNSLKGTAPNPADRHHDDARGQIDLLYRHVGAAYASRGVPNG